MSLHGLLSVTMGVPNVDETAAYYADLASARRKTAGSAPATPAASCGSSARRPGAWSKCGSPPTTRTT